MIYDDLINLTNGIGETVAMWKPGEFPDFLGTYLNTLPNENLRFTYRISYKAQLYEVPPGWPLGIAVLRALIELEDQQDDAETTEEDGAETTEEDGAERPEARHWLRLADKTICVEVYPNAGPDDAGILRAARTAYAKYALEVDGTDDCGRVIPMLYDNLSPRQERAWFAAMGAVLRS